MPSRLSSSRGEVVYPLWLLSLLLVLPLSSCFSFLPFAIRCSRTLTLNSDRVSTVIQDVVFSQVFQRELDKFTGLDIPRPVLEAMNLSANKLMEWPILYFTNSFGRSKASRNLVLSNHRLLSSADKEDQESNDDLSKPEFTNGLANWTFLLARHRDPVVRQAACYWWEIVEQLRSFAPSSRPWEADRILLNDVRRSSAPFSVRVPDLSDELFIQKAMEDYRSQEKKKLETSLESKLEALLPKALEKIKSNAGVMQFFRGSSSLSSPSSTEPSARGQRSGGNTTQRPASNTKPFSFGTPKWCIICGATTHTLATCNESKQVDGRDVAAFRNADKKWVLEGNRKFCFAYNGGSSEYCDDKNCSKGAHICSRCGKEGHRASKCP